MSIPFSCVSVICLQDLGINDYLKYLAVERRVSPGTQNLALNALNFLYTQVLGMPFGELGDFVRAKSKKRLPVVLTVGVV